MKLFTNGSAMSVEDIPVVDFEFFARSIAEAIKSSASIVALFAVPDYGKGAARTAAELTALPTNAATEKRARLFAFLGLPTKGMIGGIAADISSSFPSLTPKIPQAHMFEREIFENTGIVPVGHPWLKPVRKIFDYDFYSLEGGQTHEVAVGPVHAGVIEPGHFRFQCYGEEVEHLEIALGYQHRGIEKALAGGPDIRTMHFIETAAGDTTIGHATAYAMLIEALTSTQPDARAEAVRGIALELERMANHIGDLGALAGDVGYLPTKSFCGRLRGEVLNLTAEICGNRFGRGIVQLGGVGFDIDENMAVSIAARLQKIVKDTDEAVGLLWDSPSVLARFERTGMLKKETALELGLVGPAARACGIERDVRSDYPSGIYKYAAIPVATYPTGDVYARAMVRMLEYQRSASAILDVLAVLPAGNTGKPASRALPSRSIALSLVEGWRGKICHCAITDNRGAFLYYKIVDPSFHNWPGLAYALRGQQISDFPLCNKSFNLSYCGFDL
jgi:Ni,Fe-hydrogenase III large subunit